MKNKNLVLTILVISAVTFLTGCGGGSDNGRLYRVEQELRQQRQSTSNAEGAAVVFAFGAVVLLVVGTAIGSRVRRYAKRS